MAFPKIFSKLFKNAGGGINSFYSFTKNISGAEGIDYE